MAAVRCWAGAAYFGWGTWWLIIVVSKATVLNTVLVAVARVVHNPPAAGDDAGRWADPLLPGCSCALLEP